MDFKTAAINYGDGVTDAMEERGINEDDIRAVLEYAESEGKKLYVEGEEHFLARKRIGEFLRLRGVQPERRQRGSAQRLQPRCDAFRGSVTSWEVINHVEVL